MGYLRGSSGLPSMDIVSMVAGCFRRNKLEYVFHGSCRRVLSMALEPIHSVRRVSSTVELAADPENRRCVALDESKLSVKDSTVYVWSAVDVDSGKLLTVEASYGRKCLNKPKVVVDKAMVSMGLKQA